MVRGHRLASRQRPKTKHNDHIQVFLRARTDDHGEHTGSKKLRLSEHGDSPSNAPISADVNLSSVDMRVECVLERFEQECVANKSSEPVLCWIAGETFDEQFLGVAGLHKLARKRVTDDLLKKAWCLDDIHVVEVFSQPKTRATASRMCLTPGHVTQLLGPACLNEHRTTMQIPANRENCALGWIAKLRGVYGPAVEGPKNILQTLESVSGAQVKTTKEFGTFMTNCHPIVEELAASVHIISARPATNTGRNHWGC